MDGAGVPAAGAVVGLSVVVGVDMVKGKGWVDQSKELVQTEMVVRWLITSRGIKIDGVA